MKKISLLISACAVVASTSAYAWPDQNEFGQYCVRDMQTRGYAFLWNATNEGKAIAKDETLGLKSRQDVLFISDIGRYNDALDWRLKGEFGGKVTQDTGIRMAGANVVCLRTKTAAEAARAAWVSYYETKPINDFGSPRGNTTPLTIDVDMDWPLEPKE